MSSDDDNAIIGSIPQVEDGESPLGRTGGPGGQKPQAGHRHIRKRKTKRTAARRQVPRKEENKETWSGVGESAGGVVALLEDKPLKYYQYSNELADKICTRIAMGESVVGICERKGYPDRKTVFRWRLRHPEFAEKYALAIACRDEYLAEECLHLADTATETSHFGILDRRIAERHYLLGRITAPKSPAAVVQPDGEEAKVIDGKRLDTDPLYQAFLAWDRAAK